MYIYIHIYIYIYIYIYICEYMKTDSDVSYGCGSYFIHPGKPWEFPSP